MKKRKWFGLVALSAVWGCSNTVTCDGSLVPAIQLTVKDAQSGVFLASQTTVIVIRRGAAPDTIPPSQLLADSSPIWIGKVSGTYDLVVRRAGYADLSMPAIVVPAADVCHPSTVAVEAKLAKTG